MAGLTYALLIAIEHYNDSTHFPRVRFAIKDATELADALKSTGVDGDDITMLLDSRATKTAIDKEINNLIKKVNESDRVIIYFAGHGAFENKENYLLPVDCYNDDLATTSVSVNGILGKLKKSFCEKNLLFLDCCHSGFEPGDDTREIDRNFLADELIYDSKDEEYTIGFASCKSNQTSIADPTLKNGVWSHFLIKALRGDAGKIYDSGLLFSDKLQSYLNKSTKEYVKLNTKSKKDQVPIVFGNVTDRFVIADLNPVFEERERSKKVDDISFTEITLLSEDGGQVKSLPGFQKRFHSVPTSVNYKTDNFIKKIGASIITDEISELSQEVISRLKYKLRQVDAYSDNGAGVISTPDFTYSMEIILSPQEPQQYLLIRKLSNFRSSEMALNPEFNEIFSNHFERLEFALSRRIDIEKFIHNFEDLEDIENIELEYNPSDLTSCIVLVKGLAYEVLVTPDSLSITSNIKTSPEKLINAYRNAHKALLSNPTLKLLE
jgi:hypothetical protein